MWVLFLAVASFLAYVGIVALLCLAEGLESRTRRARPPIRRVDPFSTLNLAQAFEPTFAALWEAPIRALSRLSSAGAEGLPASQLRSIYREAAARFPEIYDGYHFQQWLQFLENSELICWDGQQVTLTRKGREFLEYRFITRAFAQT
jgi:hypothetical protein